jgi:hypothetical protein
MDQTNNPPCTRAEFLELVAAVARVEEMLRAQKLLSPIITREEAKALSTRNDDSAFDRWRNFWGVDRVSHGRYSRAACELALKREAGELPVPATLRRKQADLRRRELPSLERQMTKSESGSN